MRYHLILISTLLLANGCFFLPSWGGDDYYDDWDSYDEVYEVDGRISDASLSGNMYDLGTFEGDVYDAEYVGGYGSSTITLHAGENGGADFGWAMIALTTYEEGGFEGDAFLPGNTVTLEDGAGLDAQGCTGPEHGNWDFDGHAEVVEITVEEGPTPSSRLFHFRAVYSQSDGGTTEGSFVIELPEDGAGGTVRG